MVYYISGLGELKRYHLQTQELVTLYEAVRSYWIGEERLYLTFSDREGLYVVPLDELSAQPTKLSDLTPETLDEYGHTVVYEQGERIAYIDMSAPEHVEHFIEASGYLAGISGKTVYTFDYGEGKMKVREYDIPPTPHPNPPPAKV